MKTFIHTIYILQLQQPVHRLKMKILISQYTNAKTQTIMDTIPTTTFWILAKTSMHTICRLQHEEPVYRFKAKILISLCKNERTQANIFLIVSNNVLTLKTTYTPVFHNNSRFMNILHQRHVYLCWLNNTTNTRGRTQSILSLTDCRIFSTFDPFRPFHPFIHSC